MENGPVTDLVGSRSLVWSNGFWWGADLGPQCQAYSGLCMLPFEPASIDWWLVLSPATEGGADRGQLVKNGICMWQMTYRCLCWTAAIWEPYFTKRRRNPINHLAVVILGVIVASSYIEKLVLTWAPIMYSSARACCRAAGKTACKATCKAAWSPTCTAGSWKDAITEMSYSNCEQQTYLEGSGQHQYVTGTDMHVELGYRWHRQPLQLRYEYIPCEEA